MQTRAFQKWAHQHRVDPEIAYKRRLCRYRGVGLWFISVQIDLKRLLNHRGGSDSVIETYLRVPSLIYRSGSTVIGEEIELTLEERMILRITSIRPSDVPWRACRAQYKIERNRRKRERPLRGVGEAQFPITILLPEPSLGRLRASAGRRGSAVAKPSVRLKSATPL